MKPRDEERRRGPRPGGHGGYRLGGEPATGHRWDEAQPPPPAPSARYEAAARYDDGVAQRHHEPDELDPDHNEDVAHEHSDINVRALVGSAVIMTVVIVVSQILMYLMFGWFEQQAAANDPVVSPLAVPSTDMPRTTLGSPFFNAGVGGAQLLTNEPMALSKFRDSEEKRLRGYGWVNQPAGVAFMPIEQAKKLILERGLPVREGAAVAPGLGTGAPARGESSGGRTITALPDAQEAPAAAPPAGHGQPAATPGHPPAPAPTGRGGH